MHLAFDNTYAKLPDRFFARVKPTPVARPVLLAINDELASFLGWEEADRAANSADFFTGNRLPEGAEPIALAYAGHQFGSFVPQLGDGRAILLGEVRGRDGKRYDVQLKGAGRTPFSRGGDGRAAVGPVLRELVVSEAMAALGVPTTRTLGAAATGEPIYRETPLPGAVLVRVAASHLRIGTFQYFAARGDRDAIETLAGYALGRHYPEAKLADGPALALLDAVMDAQASLVARWLGLGFVHGVMNTDNMSISGETLDYGPCAFLDGFDPDRTFSSIDRGGRYAYQNQPSIALWNLCRLGDTLVDLVDTDEARAVGRLNERLGTFPQRFASAYERVLRGKLGLFTAREGDAALGKELLALMAETHVDYTRCFRRLSDAAESGDDGPLAALFREPVRLREWTARWWARLAEEPQSREERGRAMRAHNPAFIPRNHRIEEMIEAAMQGDLRPLARLRRVLSRPYDDQPDEVDLTEPPGEEQWRYRTFCGT
ncbi:MAG: YdiU family protein [Byssovorax sp.]